MKIKLLAMATLIIFFSNMVQAATYTYTISGALIDDGSEISGSFDFDDIALTFSNVLMSLSGATVPTSTSGHAFDGLYDTGSLAPFNRTIFTRAGLSSPGNPAIGFILNSDLTTLGSASAGFALVGYGNCSLGCAGFSGGFTGAPSNGLLEGRLSVVPLPATLPLYGAGVVLLGLLSWRRRRKI